jgi:antitoxin component YwqK of YwqJK toxin-antitoxin module
MKKYFFLLIIRISFSQSEYISYDDRIFNVGKSLFICNENYIEFDNCDNRNADKKILNKLDSSLPVCITYLGDSIFFISKLSHFHENDTNRKIFVNSYYKLGINNQLYLEGMSWNRTINGIPLSLINYKKGKAHGDYLTFDSLSNIMSHQQYFEGELQGLSTHYFSNGRVKSIGNFSKNCQFGYWIDYSINGVVIKEGNYEIIKIESKKGGFLFSVKHGKWKYYNDDGTICEIIEYDRDEILKIE